MNEKQKWKHAKKIRIDEHFLMKAESSDIRSDDDVKKSGGGDEYMKFLLNALCIKTNM